MVRTFALHQSLNLEERNFFWGISDSAYVSENTRELNWGRKKFSTKTENGRYLNVNVQWESTSDWRRIILGYNALSCNFCDCDFGCWGNIISPLLRWKFVLRPSAKTQGSNERLHGEVVALRVCDFRNSQGSVRSFHVLKLIYNSQFSSILLWTDTRQVQGFKDFEIIWSYIFLKTKT